MTHVHRRSNPCWPDRTQQVAVSGRSRDACSQAVKSLPARPHSTGCRVREKPRHTFTGGQIPASQTTLGRSLCQRGAPKRTQAVFPAGQTALGRSPCQGGAASGRNCGHSCRPDCTQLVTVPGRSRSTHTQAVIPAGQTALSWSPCQGGAVTHVHRRSSLSARPHSAGHRAREEPRHRYTCGQLCWPDHTQ